MVYLFFDYSMTDSTTVQVTKLSRHFEIEIYNPKFCPLISLSRVKKRFLIFRIFLFFMKSYLNYLGSATFCNESNLKKCIICIHFYVNVYVSILSKKKRNFRYKRYSLKYTKYANNKPYKNKHQST